MHQRLSVLIIGLISGLAAAFVLAAIPSVQAQPETLPALQLATPTPTPSPDIYTPPDCSDSEDINNGNGPYTVWTGAVHVAAGAQVDIAFDQDNWFFNRPASNGYNLTGFTIYFTADTYNDSAWGGMLDSNGNYIDPNVGAHGVVFGVGPVAPGPNTFARGGSVPTTPSRLITGARFIVGTGYSMVGATITRIDVYNICGYFEANCEDEYEISAIVGSVPISSQLSAGITLTLDITDTSVITTGIYVAESTSGVWYATPTDYANDTNRRYDLAGSDDGITWMPLPDCYDAAEWVMCWVQVGNYERIYFVDGNDDGKVHLRVNDSVIFSDNAGVITITWGIAEESFSVWGDGNMEFQPDSPYWEAWTPEGAFGRLDARDSEVVDTYGEPHCGLGFQILGDHMLGPYLGITQDFYWQGGTLAWTIAARGHGEPFTSPSFEAYLIGPGGTTSLVLADPEIGTWTVYSGTVSLPTAGNYIVVAESLGGSGSWLYIDDFEGGYDVVSSSCASDPPGNGNLLGDGDMEQYPTSTYWDETDSVYSGDFVRVNSLVSDLSEYGDASCGSGMHAVGLDYLSVVPGDNGAAISQDFVFPGGTLYWRLDARYKFLTGGLTVYLASDSLGGTRTYLLSEESLQGAWTDYYGQVANVAAGTYYIVIQPSFVYFNAMVLVDNVMVYNAPVGSNCGLISEDGLGDGDMEQYPTSTYWECDNAGICTFGRKNNTQPLDNLGYPYGPACGNGWQQIGWGTDSFTGDLIQNDGIRQMFIWSGGTAYWYYAVNSENMTNFDEIDIHLVGTAESVDITASGVISPTWGYYSGTISLQPGTYYLYAQSTADNVDLRTFGLDEVAISHVPLNDICHGGTEPPVVVPPGTAGGKLGDGDMEEFPTSHYWFLTDPINFVFGRTNPESQVADTYGQPACGDGFHVVGRNLLSALFSDDLGPIKQSFTWPGGAGYWGAYVRGDGISPAATIQIKSATSQNTYTLVDSESVLDDWVWYSDTLNIPPGQYDIVLDHDAGLGGLTDLNSYAAFDNVFVDTVPPLDCRSTGGPGWIWGSNCQRPTDYLNVAQWVDYAVCRVLSFLTWNEGNTNQIEIEWGKLAEYEPFGTIDELGDAYDAAKTELMGPDYNWSSAGLPGQEDAPTVFWENNEDTVWFGGPFELDLDNVSTYSSTCTLKLLDITGPLIGRTVCFATDVMHQTGMSAWVQFWMNLVTLILFLTYIGRRWVHLGLQ